MSAPSQADAVLEALGGGKFVVGERVRFSGGALGVVIGFIDNALGHTWWQVKVDMPDRPFHNGLVEVMDDDIERA